MTLFDLSPEELPVFTSLIAIQMSIGLTPKQQVVLGQFFILLGDNLSMIGVQAEALKEIAESNKDIKEKEK
ncbi:hypothetical protein CPJCM30710_11740 [Clostridium polyendosporum]|uniref:Uncharacterized protein n=1 Tax=Clostridium polyendosporum TaxID=69208 RepID=A0A919S0S2_9CLOT|nr:hypothetical protein [Clostridium polyendosporum]GIM28508.1 hypothetical protein CPJCM30710_11740 [Clostridium polyendosporum]